jgi:hypothetical protein
MPKQQQKLNKKQKEAMANALAEFFFNMFQNQSKRANGAVALEAGSSHRGGFPATKATT